MGESRELLWSGKSVAEERESEVLERESSAELLKKKGIKKGRKKEKYSVHLSMAEKVCECAQKTETMLNEKSKN